MLRLVLTLIVLSTGRVVAASDTDQDLVAAMRFFADKSGALSQQGKPLRLWCDAIVDQRYHFPSPATEHLRVKIEEAAQVYFSLVTRDSLDYAASQGEMALSYSEDVQPGSGISPMRYLGYQLRLKGNYQVSSDRLLVSLTLIHAETLQKWTKTLNLKLVKGHYEGLSVEPDLSEKDKQEIPQVAASVMGKNSDLTIEIWPHRGDGASYTGGDHIFIQVRANRDCYVRLYHIDVDGKIRFLLPNPPSENWWIQAGRIYNLPDDYYGKSARIWRVSEKPGSLFGVEKIKAVAQTEPFADSPREELVGDYQPETFRGLIMRGTYKRTLDDESTGQKTTLVTEAFCTYRTIKRR